MLHYETCKVKHLQGIGIYNDAGWQ